MILLASRKPQRPGSCLLAVLGIVGFLVGTARGQQAKGMKEIHAINSEWEQTMLKASEVRRQSKSPLELE